ncbi:MAG TPA: amidohydrolase [Nocardioidaceae bacterium]|nr:amidohydrolase [Nocardioidaceae bacterium]
MSSHSDLVANVDDLVPSLISLRRKIHAHPELAWEEKNTTELVATELDAAGIAFQRLPTTGLVVDLGSVHESARRIALRADLDALPVQDTTSDPWRSSVDGVAHACGHDVHTTALLGAGLALARLDDAGALPGRVRLIFQPAEEMMPGGANELMAGGVLDGVSSIFTLHCDPTLDIGQVGLREGAITGAADMVSIRLSGRGGHTSRPHLTEDLTFALGVLMTQLPAALSRRLDPRAGATLVWGRVHAGEAPNVIPITGEAAGTLRMLDIGAWHQAEGVVRELVRDLTAPYGVTADISYVRGVPPVVNDAIATDTLRRSVEATLGLEGVASTAQSLGGEDFAWYLESVPGALGRLGTRTPGGATYELHQGSLRVDENAVAVGAKVLATTALLALA